MSATSKLEKAIDYIAKHGTARSPEIAKASGMKSDEVSARLHAYVKAGVLVSCRVAYPGKPSCNEYRLGSHVTAAAWRDFKVNVHSSAHEKKRMATNNKPNPPPAPTPADQPQVSDNNSGSTSADSSLVATGRAVTKEKPHRKAAQHASGAGGHVTAKAVQNIPENISEQPKFGYFSDGSIEIIDHGIVTVLDAADAKRLADFLMNCMISNEVNA